MAEYEKVTHREHILKRPDTYVGSLEHDDFIGMSPALLKIFDEILVNAFDEHMRDPKMNTIEVEVSTSSSKITVKNNKCIPVILHPKEKDTWVPELVFGHLLTSSNYDDSKDRFTGGRNGYGAKLTNIFSKEFTVVSCDPDTQKEYSQTWKNNMSECSKPKIKKYTKKSGWLTVSFVPDESLVGKINLDVVKKRVREIGLWVPKVSFNGEDLHSDLVSYANVSEEDDSVYAHHKQKSWEIVVKRSERGEFRHESFVNGISTTTGGTHVDQLIQSLCKTGAFGKDVKPYQAKQHLHVFVKVLVNKPTFSSQTKTECTSKNLEPLEFKPKFVKDLARLGLEEVLSASRLKKSDGSKRTKIQGIPKLDDANWAGGPKSQQCTLILTEGDSAKALAVAGLSVVGRDRFGVFPLKGKPKNVRDSSVKSLESNKEFSDLKKILGLKQNEVYNDTKSLRYGRVLIMTDADLDGSHIKGLIINMFHCFWPSLLKIGYVCAMVTPVIKAGSVWFFTEDEYRARSSSSGGVGMPKYYKGLGTSTTSEAKEYFKMLDKLTVTFDADKNTDSSMTLAFSKDMADLRKDWLREYTAVREKPVIPYGHIQTLTISDFIRKDQVKFSEEDIRRSIPHLMDGLKPSQRKVVFACLKKNLERDMTVAQLAGYIGEHTAYHHGDASMHGTIVGLAQDFVGSNNMNLLVPSGQFGSRLEGGKDCASARYISTRLSSYTRSIFDKRDEPILTWLTEDAKSIEPEFYVPVIPMVLVNGCEGIGTGFSTFIPPYKPSDIVRNLIRLLDREPIVSMTPYYRGFTGSIEKVNETTWILRGKMRKDKNVITVTELPPGKWIQDYKEYLESLVSEGKIKSYENHSTESKPNFTIHTNSDFDDVKLNRTIHTSNMYLMTREGIKKFETPEEILVAYAKTRLGFYKLRKKHLIDKASDELQALSEIRRFIQLVIDGTIIIFRQTKKDIEKSLMHHKFEKSIWGDLFDIKTYQYTSDELEKLDTKMAKLRDTIETLKVTSVSEMWKSDLGLIQDVDQSS